MKESVTTNINDELNPKLTGIDVEDYLNPNYQLVLDKEKHIVTLYDKKTKRVIGTDTQENGLKVLGNWLKQHDKKRKS